MRYLIGMMACLLLVGCSPRQESDVPSETVPESDGRLPDLSKFETIKKNMTTDQIISILGMPDRNDGGIFWEGEYDLPDGTIVIVRSDGNKTLSVLHVNRATGNHTELLTKDSEQ